MTLVKVECPATRRSNFGTHLCGELIEEVPAAWGPIHVIKLTDYGARTGHRKIKRCRKCGTWLEVEYDGLALRSA